MKKRSIITDMFHWLFGKTIDRAMSERIHSEDSAQSLCMCAVSVPQQPRVRSRINRYLPLFNPDSILSRICLVSLIFLIVGGFSTSVWASATVTFNATNSSFSGSAPYSISQDSVTFSLNVPNWYNGGNNGHFYIYTSNTTATIGWTPATGFTIAVTGVSLNGQNAQEKHWTKWRTGISYIRSHTASDNTEVQISQNNTTNTYPFTTSNTNLFPSGNALGNSAYFKLRAEKGYSDADNDNSYEYQINWATITYTVTPPAPVLKNGSSVTRSQFVEGRSNNTVTLTDYFKPFNSGVSMSYVVKKKNGSGVYETINSGYTITSNVFKTTVVGEYQIFANSNATGAFNASAASPALAVTIEEVRPVTISVGSQELYVGGTTSMTITEQLNTTNDVVFEYDENFFDYNESTHVLTAKNTGNASFSSIEKSIRVTQASDGVYEAVDMTINFMIKKNVPTFTWNTREHYYYNDTIAHFFKSSQTETAITVSSTDAAVATIVDSALVTYNKEDSTRITVTQAENYYWAEKSEYVDITKDDLVQPANHVPFTITSGENAYIKSKSNNTSWDSNGYKLGDGGWSNATAEFIIGFSGIPEYVSFDKHLDNSLGQLPVNSQAIVYESDNSESGWTQVWDDIELQKKNRTEDVSSGLVHLKPTTRYLKFYYNGSVYCHYNNIRITEKKQFTTDKEALAYDLKVGDDASVQTFKFKHANAGYTVNAVLDGSSQFAISPSGQVSNTGGDRCDSTEYTVTYTPSAEHAKHSATITFSDQLGNNRVVTLNGKTRDIRTINWSQEGGDIYTVATVELKAAGYCAREESNVGSIAYTITENTAGASITENVLRFTQAGTVVVRADANETDDYTMPEAVSKTWNVSKTPTEVVTAPTIAAFETGSAPTINAVSAEARNTVNEEPIEGLYAVKDGEDITTIGTRAIKLVFTPTASALYASTTCEVTVTVNPKAKEYDPKAETPWADVDETSAVTIPAETESLTIDEPIEVYSFTVSESTAVTITPTGGLSVGKGGVTVTGESKSSKPIVLEAAATGEAKGQSAYLRISPDYEGEMPEAEIEMFSIGFADASGATWQYVGTPIESSEPASTWFAEGEGKYIYGWDEETGEWSNAAGSRMERFRGYSVTQANASAGQKTTFRGNLVSNGTHYVPLYYHEGSKEPGGNVLANSFAAPIDITLLTAEDFGGATATIYLFNTGSPANVSDQASAEAKDNLDAPGQYIPVSPSTVEDLVKTYSTYPVVIPPMQGFYVVTDKATTLKLDYEQLVWSADYTKHGNKPLRAPKRVNQEETATAEVITLTIENSNGDKDNVVLMAKDGAHYDKSYENGADAPKIMAGNLNIFAVETDAESGLDKELAIDATNDLNGTLIGIRTGEEMRYTLRFSRVNTDEDYKLVDMENGKEVNIEEGGEYQFYAAPESTVTGRFEIQAGRSNKPAITTGAEQAETGVKVTKFIKDGEMYVLKNGVLYNAEGQIVERQ